MKEETNPNLRLGERKFWTSFRHSLKMKKNPVSINLREETSKLDNDTKNWKSIPLSDATRERLSAFKTKGSFSKVAKNCLNSTRSPSLSPSLHWMNTRWYQICTRRQILFLYINVRSLTLSLSSLYKWWIWKIVFEPVIECFDTLLFTFFFVSYNIWQTNWSDEFNLMSIQKSITIFVKQFECPC